MMFVDMILCYYLPLLQNLSTLPSKIIKCDVILQFMSLWSTDMELHEAEQKKE